MIGEILLLPGSCEPCGAPLVLVPPWESLEDERGRVMAVRAPGWRWLDPLTGTVHSCR